jgi:hypothetical protein
MRGNRAVEEAEQVVWAVLGFLDEIERGWLEVLGGQGWVMTDEPEGDAKEEQGYQGDRLSESSGARGRSVHVDFAGSVGQTERYIPGFTSSLRQPQLLICSERDSAPSSLHLEPSF